MIIPSVPEPLRDLVAQISVMLAGNTARDAVYVEGGWPIPMDGCIVVHRDFGSLLTTNAEKAKAFEALTEDVELGDLLGFPLPKAAATASGCPLVVVGKRPDGAVLCSIATSPAFLAATHNAARALCPADTEFSVRLPLDVIKERIACSIS